MKPFLALSTPERLDRLSPIPTIITIKAARDRVKCTGPQFNRAEDSQITLRSINPYTIATYIVFPW